MISHSAPLIVPITLLAERAAAKSATKRHMASKTAKAGIFLFTAFPSWQRGALFKRAAARQAAAPAFVLQILLPVGEQFRHPFVRKPEGALQILHGMEGLNGKERAFAFDFA